MNSRRRLFLSLAAAMLTALCLACIRLGDKPLWLDETVPFYWVNLSIPEMVEYNLQRDTHPLLSYLIMWVWLKFGEGEFWMRLFSALCFVFTAPVVYVIGHTVSGRRAGLTAAWLMATSPFLIRYAQDARMYMPLTLFCSLALMCAVLIISRQADQPPPVIGSAFRAKGNKGDDLLWTVYIAAVLGAMFTHNTAPLLLAVITLIFLVAIAAEPQFRWPRLRNLIIANAVILALYVFNLPFLMVGISRVADWSQPPLDLASIAKAMGAVYANSHLPLQAVALAALFASALRIWRRRKAWKWLGFAFIGSLGLPLMLLAASALFWPMFYARALIWASIPFIVACAFGIDQLPNRTLRRVVLAGLLLGNLYGALNEHQRIREPWDRIAQTVAEAAADDGAVLLCPHYLVNPFNYYWRRHQAELAVFRSHSDLTVSPFLASAADEPSQWGHPGQPRRLASLFDDHSELWIIDRSVFQRFCVSPAQFTELSSRGQQVEERSFSSNIKLYVYARNAAASE